MKKSTLLNLRKGGVIKMQDNIVYRLELTDKEFKYLEDLKQEY